ncbi:MAG: response regulator [Alphaproteobacteria bacterium]|nr:response regulator [Alphaproteobacteria bacterium]
MIDNLPILIVDDSLIVRQTVKNILAEIGYNNVCAVSNGVEALDKVKEKLSSKSDDMFKVIFLDRNMPEMDGLAFLKTFRNDLNITDTAVIMLTAYSDQESIIAALEAGAASYIIKPVPAEIIQKKMGIAEEWLAQHKKNA